jgi:hypothetical protein
VCDDEIRELLAKAGGVRTVDRETIVVGHGDDAELEGTLTVPDPRSVPSCSRMAAAEAATARGTASLPPSCGTRAWRHASPIF